MTQPQREWFEKDYYKVLGVKEDAVEKDITKAYRKLAKENHPDSHPGREEKFKEIASAYAVLSDPEKRKSYDEVRKLGPGAAGFGGGGGGAGGFDVSDLLNNLFNQQGGRGRAGGGARARVPRRGDDLETSLTMNFGEAMDGITTAVSVVGEGPCDTCHATGAAPGSAPVICNACGGRGVVDANQGFFSFSSPCTTCGGTGMRIEKPCPTCRGTGGMRQSRQVKFNVPAGVEDGQRIRVKGKGGMGINNGPPGDLWVTVRVGRHDLFGRKGPDLTLTVPITYPEAVLGATVAVPTLTDSVKIKIPAGTRSGRTIRVRGRGAQTKGGHGDLLVTIEVVVPQRISDDERKAIDALAATMHAGDLRSHLGV
jgi:molecular chaperone DnaJ